MRATSTTLGLILAALAPSVCLVAYGMVSTAGGEKAIDSFAFAALVLAILFVVTLIPTLLLGYPFVRWLGKRGFLNWLNACVGATVIGALTVALAGVALPYPGFPSPVGLGVGAGLGLIAGVAFCLGARPNNSFKPTSLRDAA